MKRSKGIHVFKKPSFSKKKEKDFKVKEKLPKEEKKDKEKDKKSKDLTAADVVKQWKEKKKKKKPAPPSAEPEVVATETVAMLRPIFGAPLEEAVRRTSLYDGIPLPAVFRECVDYVESYGMKCEGIYRVSGNTTSTDL